MSIANIDSGEGPSSGNYSAAGAKDRSFLFCTLAIKLQFLSSNQVQDIVTAWSSDPSLSIEQYCQENNLLTEKECSILLAVADRLIARNQSDARQSLTNAMADESMAPLLADLRASNVDVAEFFGLKSDEITDATFDDEFRLSDEDRFEVLRLLARGGLGEVFVANDKELNREVAIKKIQDWHADNAESHERFMLEAEVTGRLEHPGIVPVYGMGLDRKQQPYYAMRLIQGSSLKEDVLSYHDEEDASASVRAVHFRRLLTQFVDVCEAVAYAHSRGVLHRDIKPSNIILGKFGETLVVDWGLAKILDGSDEIESTEEILVPSSGSSISHTILGRAVGTPAYMSPEQAAGRVDELDGRTDVYSLGATLHTILTGKPPFKNTKNVLTNVQLGKSESPLAVNAKLPKPLVAIAKKAMSLDPDARYASPRDLATDVELWLADEPISAYNDDLPDRMQRTYRRNRPLFHVAAIFLALATASAIFTATHLARKNIALAESNRATAEQRDAAKENFSTALDMALRLESLSNRELSNFPGLIPKRLRIAEKATETTRILYEKQPNNTDIAFAYAQMLRNAGQLHRLTNSPDAAEAELDLCVEITSKLYEQTKRADIAHELAKAFHSKSVLQSRLGRLNEKKQLLEKSRSVSEELVSRHPDNLTYRRTLAIANSELAYYWWDVGLSDLAVKLAATTQTKFETLTKSADSEDRDISGLIDCIEIQIRSELESGDVSRAVKLAQDALKLAANRYERSSNNSSTHFWLQSLMRDAEVRLTAAETHESYDEASQWKQTAIQQLSEAQLVARKLVEDFGGFKIYHLDLSRCLLLQAQFANLNDDMRDDYLDEAVRIVEPIANNTSLLRYQVALAEAYWLRSRLKQDKQTAVADAASAVKIQIEICKTNPNNVSSAETLEKMREHKQKLSNSATDSGDSAESSSTVR